MVSKPDSGKPPENELFRKAQYIVQLLAGIKMRSDEYQEKVDIVVEQLTAVYRLGYAHATARDVFRRETVRPPTPPGGWDVEIDLDEDPDE